MGPSSTGQGVSFLPQRPARTREPGPRQVLLSSDWRAQEDGGREPDQPEATLDMGLWAAHETLLLTC